MLGGLVGASLYAHVYPFLKNTVLKGDMLGYFTIDQVLNVNRWIVISGLLVMVIGVFYLVGMYENRILKARFYKK